MRNGRFELTKRAGGGKLHHIPTSDTPHTFVVVVTAATPERSFYCTGDTYYLLDDTQPTSEPAHAASSNSFQPDPSATQFIRSSRLSHASSRSPALGESVFASPTSTPSGSKSRSEGRFTYSGFTYSGSKSAEGIL